MTLQVGIPESTIDTAYISAFDRMRDVLDLMRPFFYVRQSNSHLQGRFESAIQLYNCVSAEELAMVSQSIEVMNRAIREGILTAKAGIMYDLFAENNSIALDYLFPGIFDSEIFEKKLVADYGFQWFPAGFFLELTSAQTQTLLDTVELGAGAIALLLIELGVPKPLAGIFAKLLAHVGKLQLQLMAALSDKGAIKLKFIPALPVWIMLPLPA